MKLSVLFLAVTAISFAGETKLGKPLTQQQQVAIADLAAKPADFAGKTVQVKGKVSEVCEKMGCWMMLVDPATKASIKIKVKDGEMVFPTTAIGKLAVAEGKLAKIEMTKDEAIAQAKHLAEEKGRKFDPASVKGPVTVYQIQGTGAVVLE
jgi:hypothetical protein